MTLEVNHTEEFVSEFDTIISPDDIHVQIDGDIIAYACASAADGKYYLVKDGSFSGRIFKKAEEANAYLATLGLSKLWREEVYKPDPIENCLHSVKMMVKSILKGCGSDKYTIYLTGHSNFREKVAPSYKANRVGMHRPYHLASCREYLMSRFKTVMVHGAEADDAIGIAHTEFGYDNSIIASLDKDLDMLPGYHYRWAVGNSDAVLYNQTLLDAARCFYKQMITGDTTDNIEGLSMPAPSKRSYSDKPIDSMEYISEIYDYVWEGYLLKYKEESLAKEMLDREAKLLWIHRECKSVEPMGYMEFFYHIDY